MILSIFLMLLVLAVAFFHYLQGFFSATISAVLAAVSVLVAFTYYEPIVTMLNPGKFADDAHAMVLVALFSLTYIFLRLIFDKLVSGNVRMPPTLDKVGGAIMGLIVGILALGLIAVAAQAMPFAASIGGYSRYQIRPPQPIGVPISEHQNADRTVYDELNGYYISTAPGGKEAGHESLVGLPLDDLVLGFVYHTSNGGSTAGVQPFARIHPDYLQELFGNRIGIELGAKRSAQPVVGSEVVSVLGVYTVKSIPQVDSELATLRKRGDDDKLDKVLNDPTHVLLVVRVQFKLDATDTDRITRVSTGAVRLVAEVNVDGQLRYREYFPLGTVEGGKTLMVNKPDDFLFVQADKAADFLFDIDPSALPDLKVLPAKIPEDSPMFVEAKRYGRVPLAGKDIEALEPSDMVAVMRKKMVLDAVVNTSDSMKKKLLGTWSIQSTDGTTGDMTWKADGTWTAALKMNGQAMEGGGKWNFVSATADSMIIDRYVGTEGPPVQFTIKFIDATTAKLADVEGVRPVMTLTRK